MTIIIIITTIDTTNNIIILVCIKYEFFRKLLFVFFFREDLMILMVYNIAVLSILSHVYIPRTNDNLTDSTFRQNKVLSFEHAHNSYMYLDWVNSPLWHQDTRV